MTGGIAFDWTINVGNVLTLLFTVLTFIFGGIGMFYGLRSDLRLFSQSLETYGGRLLNVENDIRAISATMSQLAVQNERMDNIDERIRELGKTCDETRSWTMNQFDKLWDQREQRGGRGRV